MLRLAKILAVVLLLAPISATPLGLGDIELNSALNQQFDAEIDLIALGQTRIDDISVRLAPREAFERAGLERPLFLSRLQFDVEPGPGNTASIRIRSDQPVREPFLNFLVEVNWPSGRLLREYTVLLDPPLFLDESPAVIQAPAVAAVAPPAPTAAPSRAPAAAGEAVATPRPLPGRLSASVEIGEDGAWSYGPVQQSDTLWSIAQQFRGAGEPVTTEQVMMALLRNNPDAFFNGNINELRAGHVLRLDDPSMIALMSHAEAAAEARRQFAQWQDSKHQRADAAGARPLGGDEGGAAATGGVTAAADSGPRLRLSAPEGADVERFAMSELGEGSESADAVASRLREDLVAALEVSESARQENLELRQRLAELEEQITSMQRLLSLQDDTMAALQAGVAAGIEAPAPLPESGETPPAAAGDVESGVTTEATESAQAQPVPPAAVAPAMFPEISSLVDMILADPVMLGAAAFLLLMFATLAWLIVRRRQMAGAALEDLTPVADEAAPAPAVATPSKAAVPAASAAAIPDAFEEAVAEAQTSDDAGLDLMQAEEDDIDILAEADVYLAYRRFDKAAELLRDAIAAEPGREDLLLKLFEVHAASGNEAEFVREAEAVQARLGAGDEAMWDRIVAMGRRVAPGHALFAVAAATTATAAASAEPAALVETAADLSGNVDDIELDFSADLDLSEETPDFSRDAPVAADDGDMTLMLEGTADGLADLDMTLDDDTLARLETGADSDTLEVADAAVEVAEAREPADASAGTPQLDEPADEDLEKQLLAAGEGADVDWLSEIGNDLDFADMEGDEAGGDFSGLISGEDEVGTKLDLARAYIDMGDQDSARSILSEVTEEGNEDQQREANDLMRRIG